MSVRVLRDVNHDNQARHPGKWDIIVVVAITIAKSMLTSGAFKQQGQVAQIRRENM